MLTRAFLVLGFFAPWGALLAAEAPGHAGGKEPEGVEIESELYIGRHGYWHGGVGLVTSLREDLDLGIGGHMQREELGATEVFYFRFFREVGLSLGMDRVEA